jgi:hypothetical protein
MDVAKSVLEIERCPFYRLNHDGVVSRLNDSLEGMRF